MREYLPFAVLACACGVAARPGPARGPAAAGATTIPTAPPEGDERPAPDVASAFQRLEARWAASVPGMRPLTRRESGPEKVEVARADTQDLCVRVTFEASEPVVASLLDAQGVPLATSTEQAGGIVPEQGPVCVRKGESVQASARGPATARLLWIAWSARN